MIRPCSLRWATSAQNGLALSPPLGWRSWNFFGMSFTQVDMLKQAAAMVQRRNGRPSLQDIGYGRLGIDMGWEGCGKGRRMGEPEEG